MMVGSSAQMLFLMGARGAAEARFGGRRRCTEVRGAVNWDENDEKANRGVKELAENDRFSGGVKVQMEDIAVYVV